MEWWVLLIVLFGGFFSLLAIGLPVAFAFLLVNILGAFFFMGGLSGTCQLVLSIYSSLANFALTPIPLFIFMGEVIFRTGLARNALAALDNLLGGVPGRLAILAVGASTLFSGLTGSAISNTALLGSLLLPEMKARGYAKALMIGPLVGAGGLAMMIPPSALAVVLGSVAHISIAGILIGGILPGLMMASLYTLYIIVRVLAVPGSAPSYDRTAGRPGILRAFLVYVLPLSSVVLLVVGPIIVGVSTPTEAAALGCLGSLVLAACYGRLSFEALRAALSATVQTTCMILLIIAGSVGYSQIIAFTGAGEGLIGFILSAGLSRWAIVVSMLLLLLLLGCFMDQMAMMMITIPLFMPIVTELQVDPVWFAILMLIALDIGFTTPPFGLLLFVMKGIAPPDITMSDIYKSALPFILCNILVLALVFLFPRLILSLQGLGM